MLENLKLYLSDIWELYKDTIIGHLVNSGTVDLLLHILKSWSACEVDEEKWALPMVLYFSGMMYKYYYYLGVLTIKHNEEGKEIHN